MAVDIPVTINYTLINGTGTIATYAVPNDGNVHLVEIAALKVVTSAETGGAVTVTITDLAGHTTGALSLFAGGAAAGLATPAAAGNAAFCVPSGSLVTIAQSSALTAGASTMNAVIQVTNAATAW